MIELIVFFIVWHGVVWYGIEAGWRMVGDYLEIYYP